MLDGDRKAPQDRAGPDLEDAPGVCRGDHLGAARRDAVELPVEETPGHRRLGQIVRARAAAAGVGLLELDQPDARNLPEETACGTRLAVSSGRFRASGWSSS